MFTNLYIKTNYSLLSSLVSIDSLINYATKHDIKSLAICDDSLTSTKVFYNKCIQNKIKPIIGLDVKYNDSNILLYAKNYEGYKCLIKLSTILSERPVTKEDLSNFNKELVTILPYKDLDIYEELKPIYDTLYIGILNSKEEKEALIITNNIVFINKILYLDKAHEKYIKYLFMIRDSKTISDDVYFKDNYNYPLGKEAFNLVSSTALNNTNIISDICNLELVKNDNLLPIYNEKISVEIIGSES